MVVGDFQICGGLGTAFLLNQLRAANGKPEWGHCKYTHEYFRPGNMLWNIDTGKFIDIPTHDIKLANIQPKYMITAREYDTFKYITVLGAVKSLSGVIYRGIQDEAVYHKVVIPFNNISKYLDTIERFNNEYGVYVMPFSILARYSYTENLANWGKIFIRRMNRFINDHNNLMYKKVLGVWDKKEIAHPHLIQLSYKSLFLDLEDSNTIFDTRKSAFKEYTLSNQKDVFEPWMDILDIK